MKDKDVDLLDTEDPHTLVELSNTVTDIFQSFQNRILFLKKDCRGCSVLSPRSDLAPSETGRVHGGKKLIHVMGFTNQVSLFTAD